MKWTERLLHIGLVIAILVSIGLSAAIWLNVGQSESKSEDSSAPQATQKRNRQMLALPAQVYYHHQKVYLQGKESTTLELMQKLTKVKYEEIENPSADISKIMQFDEGISFTYLSPIAFKTFAEIYPLHVDKLAQPNFAFTQLVFDAAHQQLIFINQATGSVHTLKAMSSTKSLAQFIAHNSSGVEVSYYNEKLGYLPKDEMNLAKYSYLIAPQSYNVYTQAFFNRPDEVTSKNVSDGVELSNSSGDCLQMDNKNNQVSYQGDLLLEKGENRSLKVLDMMSRLGNESGSLRYFTQDKQTYDYRVFVEGYPLIASDYRGEVESTIKANHIRILTSQEGIQVPLPNEETAHLDSGRDLLKNLEKAGVNVQQIAHCQIGYQWKTVKDTREVQLVPTWFVYYDHHWQAADDLQKEMEDKS